MFVLQARLACEQVQNRCSSTREIKFPEASGTVAGECRRGYTTPQILTRRGSTSFLPYARNPELRMYSKLFFSFLVISLAALFAAQSVEAVKGPKITNKVYFDIQHGDEKLGRSKFRPAILVKPLLIFMNLSHHRTLRWSMS